MDLSGGNFMDWVKSMLPVVGGFNKKKDKPYVPVIGYMSAGKTTILYWVLQNVVRWTRFRDFKAEIWTEIPTIGFNFEFLETQHFRFVACDIGHGWDNVAYRLAARIMEPYFRRAPGLILVVDCADKDYIGELRSRFEAFLAVLPEGAPVLVYANKRDQQNLLTNAEIISWLGLDLLKRPWTIQPCTATIGMGILDGLEWLSAESKKESNSSSSPSSAEK